ncbi:hypothetical protein Lal_00027183 [Lupinus albus]|nr:hypothetical protein Lal_00027183 [Lupinus albus]
MQTFSLICGNIPYHGSIKDFGLACDWDNYDRKEFYYSLCRFSKEEIDLHKQMALGNLNLEDRLLHYFLSYNIMPKFSNHSEINDIELQLMAGESKIIVNARDSKIYVDVIHKMGFFRDLNDRVYNHRSDRRAAPVEPPAQAFVNPPAPQPSTFQSESSSSAQIRSNQMIMDELFSLSGYISTRMDALDAQNHQVQIELQRLAYKINMMDLDEDSSEHES